ncbi:MAG: ATP synthase F0 subunit B [Acidimicrobiales bacterium]
MTDRPSDLEPISDLPAGQPPMEAETMLRRVADIIGSARPMPLSTSVMVNRDEILEMLNDAIDRLPEELRAARWLLKERADFLAQARREGEEIIEQARARAGAMVQRTEVVKAAEARARQVVDKAEADARAMRHEIEDFCDQRLASFEIILERTARTVAEGRAKLQGTARLGGPGLSDEPDPAEATEDRGEEDAAPTAVFFDQDQR